MKIVYEYSHLGGSEILQVRFPERLGEIRDVISQVSAARSKESREKTKRGRWLFSPVDMNPQFTNGFRARGYREVRDRYTITLPHSDVATTGAFKQVDFVKESPCGGPVRQVRVYVLRHGQVPVLLQ